MGIYKTITAIKHICITYLNYDTTLYKRKFNSLLHLDWVTVCTLHSLTIELVMIDGTYLFPMLIFGNVIFIVFGEFQWSSEFNIDKCVCTNFVG